MVKQLFLSCLNDEGRSFATCIFIFGPRFKSYFALYITKYGIYVPSTLKDPLKQFITIITFVLFIEIGNGNGYPSFQNRCRFPLKITGSGRPIPGNWLNLINLL